MSNQGNQQDGDSTPPEQSVLELTDAERQWVAQQIRTASTLAKAYAGRDEHLPSLQTLGITFAAWADSPSTGREDANSVVLALGTSFGQHLVDGLGFRWVIVSDEQGTDLAVHGQPGDMLMFPISSTAKRYESQEFEFFTRLYEMISEDVAKLRKEF